MKKKTISFYTLGCRLNQSETAVIERTFETDDYKIVDFNRPADMAVINTCTVTEGGDADTRRLINRATRINPNVRIALIGCQAQVQKEKLASHPNVNWVIGNAKKFDLKKIIRTLDQNKTHVITPAIPRDAFTHPMAAIDHKLTRANLKIQDGCDFFCSFCEIPYARGRARSRKFEDILLEAKALSAAGFQEIVITGINVGTYRHNRKSLIDVINGLEQIKGLSRIRISSIEPTTIPVELIKKMGQKSKLCRYLHIPVQSCSDKILKLMKRKYTFKEYLAFIENAAKNIDGICIGTDVIVGFPGEEEEDFLETAQKLKEAPLNYFHVFSYSQRSMAKSQNLKKIIDPQEIKKRSKILRDLSARKRSLYFKSMIGKQERVLFEQKKKGLWNGLTDNYARVVVASSKPLANKMADVQLDMLHGIQLLGTIKS